MSSNAAVRRQQNIQQEVAAADATTPEKPQQPMQAGARLYPEPPFPKQHQAKPGHEYKLDPVPLYDALLRFRLPRLAVISGYGH